MLTRCLAFLPSAQLTDALYRVGQKNRTFLRYHIFAAITELYNHAVFAKVFRNYSRKQKQQFFKRVLNILCIPASVVSHLFVADHVRSQRRWQSELAAADLARVRTLWDVLVPVEVPNE